MLRKRKRESKDTEEEEDKNVVELTFITWRKPGEEKKIKVPKHLRLEFFHQVNPSMKLYFQQGKRVLCPCERVDTLQSSPILILKHERHFDEKNKKNWTPWYRTEELTVNNIPWKMIQTSSLSFTNEKQKGIRKHSDRCIRNIFYLPLQPDLKENLSYILSSDLCILVIEYLTQEVCFKWKLDLPWASWAKSAKNLIPQLYSVTNPSFSIDPFESTSSIDSSDNKIGTCVEITTLYQVPCNVQMIWKLTSLQVTSHFVRPQFTFIVGDKFKKKE